MSVTAKARATTRLHGTTALTSDKVLEVLREGTQSVKGGGASLLTTGVWNIGAHITVVRSSQNGLVMALTSGKNLVELCTFSAEVTDDGPDRRTIRVGGLETYKTQQTKMYFVIPAGPKRIPGMAPYKKFLEVVQQRIGELDATAHTVIDQS